MKILYLVLLAGLFLHGCQRRTPKDAVCLDAYRRVYRKDNVDLRVIFGYKDARPARFVGDRYELAFLIQKLLKADFRRGADGTLRRTVVGPDGGEKTLTIRLTESSIGPDDDENRRDPFQKEKTREAQQAFWEGLKEADVVFYDGHSRDGGGPDFGPPRLGPGKHPDYPWYRERRPGYDPMITALRSRKAKPLALLGLFSCASDPLFARKILEASPSTGLLGSDRLLYYAEALDDLAQSIQNVADLKCQPDFNPPGIRLMGFFVPSKQAGRPAETKVPGPKNSRPD